MPSREIFKKGSRDLECRRFKNLHTPEVQVTTLCPFQFPLSMYCVPTRPAALRVLFQAAINADYIKNGNRLIGSVSVSLSLIANAATVILFISFGAKAAGSRKFRTRKKGN